MFNKEISGIPKKLAKQISKSRPYFDLKSREPEIRKCVQQAAALFERQKTSVEMAREQVQILHCSLNNNQELDAEKQYVEVIEQQLGLVKEAEEECLKAEKMHAARVRDLLQIEMALSKLLQEHGWVKEEKMYIAVEKRLRYNPQRDVSQPCVPQLQFSRFFSDNLTF